MPIVIADGRDSESFATLKNILDDLLSKNTSEEIKIKETLDNTLAQKYVEEVK